VVAQYRAVGETTSDFGVALAMLRNINDSATYEGIITTIRVSTNLEELTLDEIESKMMVETRDIDLGSKRGSGFVASERLPCLHCGRTNHSPESCWIKYHHKKTKKETGKFPKKRTTRNIQTSLKMKLQQRIKFTVMAKAGPEE